MNEPTLIALARDRIFELVKADIAAGDSPFTEIFKGARSTEIDFTIRLQGIVGRGLLAMNVREQKK